MSNANESCSESPRRLISARTEGIGLLLFTACSWGLTWPQSKFLLTMLPPFSMRAACGVLAFSFAFLIALVRGENLWPPRDQWPDLLLDAFADPRYDDIDVRREAHDQIDAALAAWTRDQDRNALDLVVGAPVGDEALPAGVGDPDKAEVLKNIPTLIVYGDYIEKDSRWPKIRATGIAFGDKIKAAGGSVDVVDLPQVGITGNSHMLMMDKNNAEVAALIQKWLEGKGLTK